MFVSALILGVLFLLSSVWLIMPFFDSEYVYNFQKKAFDLLLPKSPEDKLKSVLSAFFVYGGVWFILFYIFFYFDYLVSFLIP
jgi:hypothetical protein